MEKDTWIAEVLNSTNDISRLAPRESLLHDIQRRVATGRVPAKTLWIAAASVAALIALNFAIIKSSGKGTPQPDAADSPFYTNNQLY